MTEQDKFEQAFDPEASDRAFLKSIRDGDGYRQFATYLNGAWWGWQAKAKHTGNDPEMGFMLEAANEGELAAYDHGCAEAQQWLDDMLNKPLDHVRAGGFSSDKINEQRAAILALREKAERYDWLERWFKERRSISFEEAQSFAVREDLCMVKAAYAAGMTRGTQETMLVMSRPLLVQMPVPLKQIGWRWHHQKAPPGHQFSPIFTDDKPGPERHAAAAAQNSSFGPTTVQAVYILDLPTNGSSIPK